MSGFPNFLKISVGLTCSAWADWFQNTVGQFYKLLGFIPPNFPDQICGFLDFSSLANIIPIG